MPRFGRGSRGVPNGLDLRCRGKKNQQGFQDELGFVYFTSFRKSLEEPAGMGSDQEVRHPNGHM